MLSDEEKEAIDNMKSLLLYSKEHEYFSPFQEQEIDDMNIVLNLVEKQSKEIEELKDMNERQQYRIELVSEDEIEERGDSIDESTMLKQIKNKLDEKNIPIETLLAEFERLEDLEDRKVQIEYNNVFNKGVKSVEDKIKAKIEPKLKELDEQINEEWKKYGNSKELQDMEDMYNFLQSLLEKE